MNTLDLQIQTTMSDGKHAPAECVAMAREYQVSVIAITDHDTVAGVEEAMSAGAKKNIRVIPGIEMSVEEHGLHILGYGIDCANQELLEKLEESRQGRIEGAQKMVKNLQRAGFVVEWDDVLRHAVGAVIARPHLAAAVLGREENKEKLGGIATAHDFIEAHLSNENQNYVHRTHISAKDAVTLINRAGGVAVWSHPAIHFRERPDELEQMLQDLLKWGIEGVEVFNPSHTEDDAEYLEGLAKKYALLRTAGSDFHEARISARDDRGLHSAEFIGDYETYGFSTDDIVEKLDEAMERKKISQ